MHCRGLWKLCKTSGCLLAVFLLCRPPAEARNDPETIAFLGPGFRGIHLLRGSQNHLLIFTKVNGSFAMFGVDTGAPITAFNSESGELFKVRAVPPGAPIPSSIRIGGQPVPIGLVDDLQAGDVKLGIRPVALVNLSHINEAKLYVNGRRRVMEGLIGADTLLDYSCVLDYARQQLSFKMESTGASHLASSMARSGYTRVPMAIEQGHFTVPCLLEGHPYRMVVDTGSFITLVDRAFMRRQGVFGARTRLSGENINGHTHPVTATRFRQFVVGAFTFPSVPVGITDLSEAWNSKVIDNRPPLVGLLGGELLAERSAVIDIGAMALYLR